MVNPQILELGCGSGCLANQLSRIGNVTGIDFSDKAIELAKKRYAHVEFILGNFLETAFEKNKYDLVVASEVVEHLTSPDQKEFIRIIHHSLKKEAYLILTTPNKIVADKWQTSHQPVENWLTIGEISDILSPCFRILSVKTTYFLSYLAGLSLLRPVVYVSHRLPSMNFHVVERVMQSSKQGLYIAILAQKRCQTRLN